MASRTLIDFVGKSLELCLLMTTIIEFSVSILHKGGPTRIETVTFLMGHEKCQLGNVHFKTKLIQRVIMTRQYLCSIDHTKCMKAH